MKQLSPEKMMDYLDGTLSPEEMAHVEAHLQENEEDADLVRSIQSSLAFVQDVRENEPLRVSDNFWPTLRDKLGPAPQRSGWSLWKNKLANAFGPTRAAGLSFGAAFAAIVIALSAFLFAPQDASKPAVALTPEDRMFIQQSAQKHEAYVQSQPAAGDVSSFESGADDDNENDIP